MSDVEDTGEIGAAAPPARVKEAGATIVACPMLTQTNYTVWALRMKIVQAIPESLIMKIGDVKDAQILWESIRARHVGADRVKEARLQTLNTDFDRLRMDETESIDSIVGKLSGIASKSASLGEVIDESKLVKKLLKVVPRQFLHLVASLKQILDLKSVGFEDVVGRLKAYEERIKGDNGGEGQQKVLMARSGGDDSLSGGGGSRSSSGGTTGSGGTKGSRFNREGGRNRSGGFNRDGSAGGSGSNPVQNFKQPNNFKPNFDDQPNSNKKCNCDSCEKNRRSPKKDQSKIVCYRCDKPGHYASECSERPQKSQDGDFLGGEDNDEAVF